MVDGGVRFAEFANNQIRLKGYVGYQYLNDSIDAVDGRLIAEQTRQWHALRVGLTAKVTSANALAGWLMLPPFLEL